MRLSLTLSALALAATASIASAQDATTTETTSEKGITRETITKFSEAKGTVIPIEVEEYSRLRAETLGSSTQEHCVGQAGLKAMAYRKKGAAIDVIEQSDRTAFYVATLGATLTLKERVIIIYCDGYGDLMVGLKVDPNLAVQLKPVERTVKEANGSSASTTSGSDKSQPPVTININGGKSGK